MRTKSGNLRTYLNRVFACSVLAAAFHIGAVSGIPSDKTQGLDPFEFEIPAEALMNEVKDRRNVLENNVFQLVRMGDKFYNSYKYQQAYKAYTQALNVTEKQRLGSGPYLNKIKAKLKQRIDMAHKAWANDVFMQARRIYTAALTKNATPEAIAAYEKAEKTAYQAFAVYYFRNPLTQFDTKVMSSLAAKDPLFCKRIEAFVDDCKRMIGSINFQIETSLESVDPDFKRRNAEITLLLKHARTYYLQKKYEKVRINVEKILVQDPYNEDAIRLLEKTYQQLHRVAAMRRQTDAEDKITEVDWKWVEPIELPSDSESGDADKKNSKQIADDEAATEAGSSNTVLFNKLRRIIIDRVDFQQQTIKQIVDSLKILSKENDTVDHTGVDIDTAKDINDRTINTLVLENVPLLVVIKYLCKLANVTYRLDGNYVRIGNVSDKMENQSFPISNYFVNRIRAEVGDSVKKEKEEKDFDKDELENIKDKRDKNKGNSDQKENRSIDPEKLKTYFTERGVRFPEGSSISFDSESGQISMRNTKENQERLADRIHILDVPPAMVLCEAKIMEISMSALEELGFDWSMTWANASDKKVIYSSLFPGQVYSTQSDGNNILINNLNLIPNAGGDSKINLFLTVRAMDRSERAEVITMPRLIALDGNSASLDIDDERYFPEDYDDPEVDINSNGNTYTYKPPVPNFEKTTVGLQFKFTPTVVNFRTITIDLETNLKAFTGWSNYDYTIKIGKMFESIADTSSTNLYPKEKMAEFTERRIKTQVDVYNGESVVIGGVLTDITEKTDDKYPLLGDMPLVGRLFSDRSTSSGKNNFMVFVTARIIDGNGLPYGERRKDGLFHFNNR